MRETDSDHLARAKVLDMTKLGYLSVARISGPDASSFMQAQLSADVAILEPGEATFACYCSPAGKVFGLLLVCRLGDDFMVVAASSLLASILQRLRLFVLRADVELTPQAEVNVIGIEGCDSDAVGKQSVFRVPGVPDLGYLLSTNGQACDADPDRWKAMELRRNVAWLGPETTEKFIPQMLGYEKIAAVSFSKGCYPGQEIVARARYLGKVKRKPLIAEVEGMPEIKAGARLKVRRQGEWSGGTVVEHAISNERNLLLFIVTGVEPEVAAEQLEYEDQRYPCATT
jgi:folate-binding protein YgfZ